MPAPDQPAIAAATEYVRLRDRKQNPPGQFDRAGRFQPTAHYPCCDGIRSPTRAYPYSLMVHARTAVHVAAAHGVTVADLRAAVKTAVAVLHVRERMNV